MQRFFDDLAIKIKIDASSKICVLRGKMNHNQIHIKVKYITTLSLH